MTTTTKVGAIKRIPGTDPEMPLKLCRSCYYELPLSYFTSKTGLCLVCRAEAREALPWTPRQVEMLRQAARRALDLWPKYFDLWDDDDLQRWRELLAATGREGGVSVETTKGRKEQARHLADPSDEDGP